jgi:hypothetical protein
MNSGFVADGSSRLFTAYLKIRNQLEAQYRKDALHATPAERQQLRLAMERELMRRCPRPSEQTLW